MLAYRNPSNEDSDSIFNYTLKLDAYDDHDMSFCEDLLPWSDKLPAECRK